MPSFEIAHIQEQGQNMIIVPLDHNFEWKLQSEQRAAAAEIQARATAAGLAGHVAVIWEVGNGGRRFIAPQEWHPFLRTVSLAFVARNINKTLSW
jgi:hypothetical protein